MLKKFAFIIVCFFCALSVLATDKKKTSYSSLKKAPKNITHQSTAESVLTAGLVEIKAADASDYYASPDGNDFLNYLGKNVNESEIQRLINSIKGEYELINNQGNITYLWRLNGLALKFNNKSILEQVRLFNGSEFNDAFCSVYENPLPNHLSFTQNRGDIEQLIGKPIESSNPVGDEKFFASYLLEGRLFQITLVYNTSSPVEMSSTINELILSKFTSNNFEKVIENKPTENESKLAVQSLQLENNSTSYLELLGKNFKDQSVKNYVSKYSDKNTKVIDYEQSSQYLNKEAGYIINMNEYQNLSSIILTNNVEILGETFKPFQGILPSGINFSLNMGEVQERLGTPSQTSTNSENLYWEMYSINNGNEAIFVTYNTKVSTLKSAIINDVRVEKLK